MQDAAAATASRTDEGMTNMTIVDAGNVTFIGKDAFKGCTGLTQIRLAKDCDIHDTAFSGCGTMYVFSEAGGTTQTFCDGYDHLILVSEIIIK